jgi:hypothetical protein
MMMTTKTKGGHACNVDAAGEADNDRNVSIAA